MKTLTQKETVKKWLLSGKTITTFQAFSKFGITRLAARCFELREAGLKIKTKRVNKKDTHYDIYFIDK